MDTCLIPRFTWIGIVLVREAMPQHFFFHGSQCHGDAAIGRASCRSWSGSGFAAHWEGTPLCRIGPFENKRWRQRQTAGFRANRQTWLSYDRHQSFWYAGSFNCAYHAGAEPATRHQTRRRCCIPSLADLYKSVSCFLEWFLYFHFEFSTWEFRFLDDY